MLESQHAELVRAAASGGEEALGALVARHLPGLLAYVRAHAGPHLLRHEASMDLVQSACREVLQDIGRCDYRDEAGFRHWLFLAAERKLVDRARYHGRAKRQAGPNQTWSAVEEQVLASGFGALVTPSQEASAREALERVEGALGRLAADDREAIVLARIVGLSAAEIALHLGRTETAVRRLIPRALARLAREMARKP